MKPKYTARLDNVYFLAQIGASLRLATQDIAREELPTNIKLMLRRLDRLEVRDKAKSRLPKNDTSD